jgi:flagellar motor protein MotB
MEIEIAGHADGFEMEFPGFTSRQALSLARAEAVKKVLVSRFGADPARLTARGYDETRALAASDTPEGQAKNRCAEFIVTRQ